MHEGRMQSKVWVHPDGQKWEVQLDFRAPLLIWVSLN